MKKNLNQATDLMYGDFDNCTKGIPHYGQFHRIAGQVIRKQFSKYNLIRILDIGAGTGNLYVHLLGSKSNFYYVGVENNRLMYEKLVSKLHREQNVRLLLDDALLFLKTCDKNSFDLVVNSWTFHNWDDRYRKRVLRCIYKVLSKDGILLNVDKIAVDDLDVHHRNLNWQMNYVRSVFAERPDIVAEWETHYEFDESPGVKLSESDYSRLLKEIGFQAHDILARNHMDIVSVAKAKDSTRVQ